jgi:hypothetical protein
MKRSILAGVCTVLLAVAACSAEFSVGGDRLDTELLEEQIAQGVADQLGVQLTSVECPDDVAVEAGDEFECTWTDEAGDSGPVRVIQEDDQGNVSWEI